MRPNRWLVLIGLILIGGCNDQSCSNKKIDLSLPVLTQHNDERRSGVQLDTVLNTSNVQKKDGFGKLFTRTLPASPNSTGLLKDRIYTQPLVVSNVSPALVIVATDTNMVYAFDAQNPAASAPVWSANLGPPESAMDNWSDAHCNRSLPVIGVLGTPVITADEQWLYVVSKNRQGDVTSTTVSFTIHKLAVADGHEIKKASLQANGFNPYHQLQRPGLAWVLNDKAPGGGYVYAAFGGHCDAGADFHGWIFGLDGELNQVATFNTTPKSLGGGIWQAGQAPVSNSEGCPEHCQEVLYVATGNATGNAAAGNGPGQYANTVLKLRVEANGNLSYVDSFRPYNWAAIDSCDADISSAGVVLLDNYRHVVSGGKQGVLYVLDTNDLGHGVASDNNGGNFCHNPDGRGGFNTKYTWNQQGDQVFQEFEAVTPYHFQGEDIFGHIHGSPVYATLGDTHMRLYVWPEMDNLKQYKRVQGGKFDPKPEHESFNLKMVDGMPGGMLSISSGGGVDGDVILWATHPRLADAWAPSPAQPPKQPFYKDSVPAPIEGVLYAFDASDVTTPLWSSDLRPQDKLGEFSKFTSPTIWYGHVYVATFSGELQVYGLCGQPTPCVK